MWRTAQPGRAFGSGTLVERAFPERRRPRLTRPSRAGGHIEFCELGRRVPIELRIFLTAAAIVDDIAAIIVVAIFYSGALHFVWLATAVVLTGVLALFNRSAVYRALPYTL